MAEPSVFTKIETGNGRANVARAPDEMFDEDGERGTHQNGGDEKKREAENDDGDQIGARGVRGGPTKDLEGGEAEDRDAQFSQTKNQDSMAWEAGREPASGKTSETQPQHKSTDDDGHRLRVHAINREQSALPHDLIDKRGHSREKKEGAEQEVLPLLFAAIEIEARTIGSKPGR
jgi:hypothetical protein